MSYNNYHNSRSNNRHSNSNYNKPQQESEIIKKIKENGTFSDTFNSNYEYTKDDGLCHKFAKTLKSSKPAINTNQLRKFFAKVKEIDRRVIDNSEKIDNDILNRINSIMPDIAYSFGRKLIPITFYTFIKESLKSDKIKTNRDFKIFVEIFSTLVAFSKFEEEYSKHNRR